MSWKGLAAGALLAVLALGWRHRPGVPARTARTAAAGASGSRLLPSACGAIELAESGPSDAPPLLLIHGSGGGFDQALALGEALVPRGVRIIAPSRFGYLRSPMPADPSGERQSDHLACLLDALGLADAAVMGVSAGAVSALHFAVRHPSRTRALVLVVPAVYRPDPAVPMPGWALRLLDTAVGPTCRSGCWRRSRRRPRADWCLPRRPKPIPPPRPTSSIAPIGCSSRSSRSASAGGACSTIRA